MYYTTFNIYRTCMCRAPARPVRACPVRTCCTAVQEHGLRATTLQCNAKPTLSSHFTVPSSHPALHKPHFISSQATLQHLFSHSTLLHREAFTHKSQKLSRTEAFTQRSFYTEELLHGSFQTLTQRSFYTQKLLHAANFDTEKFFTQKISHREAFTHRSL